MWQMNMSLSFVHHLTLYTADLQLFNFFGYLMSVHCNKEFIISLACYMKGLINGELTKSLCYIPTDIFAKDMFQVRKALEFKI